MKKIEIADKELVEKINALPKDEMAVFVMADGRIRGALFHGTRFVNQMRAQHNLGILESLVLGQASLCAALMIPLMKGQEHLCWKYDVDGPAAGFSVEADSTGYVRGFLYNEHIPVDKPLENWDLKPFLGTGSMSVSRIHKEDSAPHISTVEVNSGNIAEDLAWYYKQSEQISTAFNTGIQFDRQGRVIGAGGMFLQVMPETGGKNNSGASKSSSSDAEADGQFLARVEMAFKTAPSLGQWFSEGGKIEDIVYGLFREFTPSVALRRDIRYDCPCSEETFANYIKMLPKQERDDILRKKEPLEIQCRNCGSVYTISVEKLQQ
ncbi:MAG: Hsp33 family molecular chaperone HslO [Treponema porcinum]|uniref:Hsp33 family molecular chaperone HslO n=1 Tax=Treponema porcinum TaxID=261392 RepID=UPI0023522EBC|nr:Hsp33 family molecular chaperone HslO [Treponema porcinum]MCI7080378.1 Hsp33 family molecular chaperone HslO [Treponema porcinum]MDY5046407.1 Hsp33 family molecular chaperone HslO [Treponema porcinum]MDY5049721.1 Hsp33 family molecular chaperone HslO [Treponema porcinum]